MSINNFIKKLIQTNTLYGGKKIKLSGIPDGSNYILDSSIQMISIDKKVIFSTTIPDFIVNGGYFRVTSGGGSNNSNLFKVLSIISDTELIIDDSEPETSSVADFGPGAATIDARLWSVVNNDDICRESLSTGNTIFNVHVFEGTGLEDGSGISENFVEHYHGIGAPDPDIEATKIVVTRNCDNSAVVGDLVMESLTITNGVDVSINNTDVRPVFGVITSKLTDTICRVMLLGELTSTIPLVKGSKVWIDSTGILTPTIQTSGYVQLLGTCIDTYKIDFRPSLTRVKRS